MNHQEVVEEDRRKKLPQNWEQKRKRVEWDEEQEKKRKVCLITKKYLGTNEGEMTGERNKIMIFLK